MKHLTTSLLAFSLLFGLAPVTADAFAALDPNIAKTGYLPNLREVQKGSIRPTRRMINARADHQSELNLEKLRQRFGGLVGTTLDQRRLNFLQYRQQRFLRNARASDFANSSRARAREFYRVFEECRLYTGARRTTCIHNAQKGDYAEARSDILTR